MGWRVGLLRWGSFRELEEKCMEYRRGDEIIRIAKSNKDLSEE